MVMISIGKRESEADGEGGHKEKCAPRFVVLQSCDVDMQLLYCVYT